MNISKDKVVSLTYTLKIEGTNEIIEDVKEDKPLTFIFGKGQMLAKFEENLKDLKINDTFDFVLKSEESYGQINDKAIVDLPKNLFEVEGKLQEELLVVGKLIPMQDKEGRRMDGKVITVSDDLVKLDFNHPMAGKNLHFNGEVCNMREATHEEIIKGSITHEGCDGCDGNCH